MALTKEHKKKIIEKLREEIDKQKIMIFLNFKGLKVNELFALRKKLKKADSRLTVAKKTLLNLVFKEKGLELDKGRLKGETALVLGCGDEILPAKIVYEFSRENKNLKILGGLFEKKFQEADKIITLAQISSREQLFAKLVRSISAPISGFVNVLQGNIRSLAYIISQIKPSA